jgi:hypothetical protein
VGARIVSGQALLPLPTNAAELERCLADPEWRLFSGCLYKIMIKGDAKPGEADPEAFVLPFKPNRGAAPLHLAAVEPKPDPQGLRARPRAPRPPYQ